MRAPLVASVSAAAVDHLVELLVAERHRLHEAERSWPAARTWVLTRDGALARLAAEAAFGLERSARTLDALVQAAFDLQYLELVAHLEEADGG